MKPRFYLLSVFFIITSTLSLKAQHPDNPLTETAILKEKNENHKGAIADCNKAIEADPQDIQAYLTRARAYGNILRYKEALADYDNVIAVANNKQVAIVPGLFDSYVLQGYVGKGNLLVKMGKSEDAIKCFDYIISTKPDNIAALYDRARAEFDLHRYNDALADDGKVIALNPGYANAYAHRAVVYDAMNRVEEAMADQTKALELHPTFQDVVFNRGYNKSRMGLYNEAKADFFSAIQLAKDNGYAFRGLGVMNYWQGNYAGADSALTKAISLKPKVPEGYEYRGMVENRLGKYDDALNDYNTAIILAPRDPYVYLNQGELKLGTGNYPEAVQVLTKSISLDTGRKVRTYNSLGYAYFKLKNYQQAIVYADSAKMNGGRDYQPYFSYRDDAAAALKGTAPANFTHLEWIGPIEDVNKMYHATIIATEQQLTIRVKISSAKSVVKGDIKLFWNGAPITDAKTVDVKGTGGNEFNRLTREYEYEYQAVVKLPKGKNVLSVMYNGKGVQPLTINNSL